MANANPKTRRGIPNRVGSELREAMAKLCEDFAGLDPETREYRRHEDKVRRALEGLLAQEDYSAFLTAFNAIRKSAVPDMKAVELSFSQPPTINVLPVGKPKNDDEQA